jgi:hypothetical protein
MRWGDDEDTDPPPRRHLSNPYARVSPHAREIIMGIMEMKPCWVRIAGVHVKGRYLLASQEKGMKPMAVATDRLWRRIWQAGGGGEGE